MKKTKYILVPCTHTECTIKDCPNYSPKYMKNGYNFPDCIEKVTKRTNERNKDGHTT